MFVIGERINGMFKDVRRAIKQKDEAYIQQLALKQIEKGANALDVNVGPASDQPEETMRWLITVIAKVSDCPLSIDSPKPAVIEKALEVCKSPAIINSSNAEEEKLDRLLDLALKWNAKLIALTTDRSGVPKDANARLELAVRIISRAQEKGFELSDLFIDPVVLPLNVAQDHCPQVLEAIRQIKMLAQPAPNTILGLSNISQGTKERSLINRIYLVMAMASGLDAAILDPLDQELVNAFKTAEVLLNRKIYCDAYLTI